MMNRILENERELIKKGQLGAEEENNALIRVTEENLLPEYNNIGICSAASRASSDFENANDHFKRRYVVRHIKIFVDTVKKVTGNCGAFGT